MRYRELPTQSYSTAQILLKPCYEAFSSFQFCDNALVRRAVMCCGLTQRVRRFLKRLFFPDEEEQLSGEVNSS